MLFFLTFYRSNNELITANSVSTNAPSQPLQSQTPQPVQMNIAQQPPPMNHHTQTMYATSNGSTLPHGQFMHGPPSKPDDQPITPHLQPHIISSQSQYDSMHYHQQPYSNYTVL